MLGCGNALAIWYIHCIYLELYVLEFVKTLLDTLWSWSDFLLINKLNTLWVVVFYDFNFECYSVPSVLSESHCLLNTGCDEDPVHKYLISVPYTLPTMLLQSFSEYKLYNILINWHKNDTTAWTNCTRSRGFQIWNFQMHCSGYSNFRWYHL